MDKEVEIKIQNLESKISDIEKRQDKLETNLNDNRNLIINLDKSLSITIEQIKNIAEDLKQTSVNFKEAIIRSNTAYTKETQTIKEKVVDLEKKYEKLDTKIDKETIGKDAEQYRTSKKQIISYIINIVLLIIVFTLGLNKFM